jgi:toxin-antitoxin system PIN domain toxin
MILIDSNLLIYAHVKNMPEHAKAKRWLDQSLNESHRVGLPWQSLLTFMRLVTNPRIFDRPEQVSDAWRQVESWLELPSVWIPLPTGAHQTILAGLMKHVSESNLVPDAHLAALAIEHGLVLCSTDGDMARFPGVNWQNPLVNAD